MSKIDTSTWKEFIYTDLFELLIVKNKLSKMDLSDEGKIPVYSSETTNNGIFGYTNCPPSFVTDEKTPIYLIFGEHTKTMNIATESFCVMDNVKVLKPKINDINQLLFITTAWKKSIPDLGYARHWSVAKDAKFKLPVTEIQEIDFDYMESYIAGVESEVCNRMSRLEHLKETQSVAIDIREWGKFHLYDIFEISMGNKFDRSKMNQLNPSINFVGRSGVDNGVACKVDLVTDSDGNIVKPYNAGDITIAMGGSIGSAFVQEQEFYTSQNVCVLHANNPQITFWAKQFIVSAISASCKKYEAFVDELNRHIKTDFAIYLPTIVDGFPDFEYMDKYMRKVHEGGGTSPSGIDKCDCVIPWGKFAIGDLFEISLSKDDIQPKNTLDGNIPLVSSGKENNGIVSMIANTNATLQQAGTITVDMFGKAFYQENEYYCVSHGRVNILTPKIPLNLYSGLFVARIIESVSLSKYSFEEMCTGTKLCKDIIYLPVHIDETPNWEYMEQYMKNLQLLAQIKIESLAAHL